MPKTRAGLIGLMAGILGCAGEATVPVWQGNQEAHLAKGGGSSVSITVNNQSNGVQAFGGPFSYTFTSDSGVQVRPACPTTSRYIRLVDVAAVDALAPGARSECNANGGNGFVFLKLLSGGRGGGSHACDGTTVPSGTNFSNTSRFFFAVDTNGDGKYTDGQYTVVLLDCYVTETGGSRTVTASQGNLYNQGGTKLNTLPFAVNVSVTY